MGETCPGGRDLVRRAFDAAYRIGDLTFASYCCCELITNFLTVGDPLAEVQPEAENALAFVQKARFGLIIDIVIVQVGLIRTLRGLTPKFGCFNDEGFDELQFERHLTSNPGLMLADFWYCTRKAQARFFAGDYASAVDASLRAQPLLWTSPSQFETAEFRFYGALSHAAYWDSAALDQRQQHFEALAAHHRQLEIWAEHCPENFGNRAALVGGEIARIEGREFDAMRLYKQAIRSAHTNGFVHNEALAYEIAARFYAARGFEQIAQLYLRNARRCYMTWGADGKVRQLDKLHPDLGKDEPARGPMGTITAPVEHLDLATVIKVSEAVSGEIVLEKLIDTLMRTAIEHAGAERGLLILPRGDEYRIEAEATTSSSEVKVELRQTSVTAADLPESVFRYALRTKECVLIHDASGQSSFSADEYVREHHARSVLCLPLLKQTRLLGVLYLENNLTHHAFTPARMAVLKLLASEAAISMENTRLYGDLQEREARVRRLVDSNIIGIFIWNLDGRIMEANEAFLHITGYARNDLLSGRLRWNELTPANWREVDEQRIAELHASGIVEPYEKEFFKQDDTRVPVLVGAAIFDGAQNEGVAFVVDLSDRKQAEEAARASERRYHEIQKDMAHANRIATIGQLSASIAHELNQPLTGIITNCSTCLRMLTGDPPNLEGARETVRRMMRDGNRASEVITRLHALFSKREATAESVDFNESTREVIALSLSELQKSRVIVRTEFADDLPLVTGDRVQLQQVVLNLLLNALDAMNNVNDRPRELVIRTERWKGECVCVSVRDSEVGFEPHAVDKLFEAFYTTKHDGMGMGLSVSRSIIESHHGRLWATPNDGPGATLSFSIPCRTDTKV